ncbi:hypothetical protein JHW43_007448 [Diplocarpon mali]|nr:hypothetical protein JHW43_007448 [Diplocarpon mali]
MHLHLARRPVLHQIDESTRRIRPSHPYPPPRRLRKSSFVGMSDPGTRWRRQSLVTAVTRMERQHDTKQHARRMATGPARSASRPSGCSSHHHYALRSNPSSPTLWSSEEMLQSPNPLGSSGILANPWMAVIHHRLLTGVLDFRVALPDADQGTCSGEKYIVARGSESGLDELGVAADNPPAGLDPLRWMSKRRPDPLPNLKGRATRFPDRRCNRGPARLVLVRPSRLGQVALLTEPSQVSELRGSPAHSEYPVERESATAPASNGPSRPPRNSTKSQAS